MCNKKSPKVGGVGGGVTGLETNFSVSSLVASERFDFTSQNIFSLARLFFFAQSHTVFRALSELSF